METPFDKKIAARQAAKAANPFTEKAAEIEARKIEARQAAEKQAAESKPVVNPFAEKAADVEARKAAARQAARVEAEKTPAPAPTLTLSDRARQRLIGTVRRGPDGGAHVVGTTSAAAFSELANLGLIEELDSRVNFVSPVDSEIPDAIREQVIKASAAVVETLTERANTLADLRRSMGAEAVDWATSRLNGILIAHVDKGWHLIGGAPRKTPEQVAQSRAARPAAAKAGVVETPVETPAVKTAVQTAVQTDKLDVIAANTRLTVDGLSALYGMFAKATENGNRLTEGVRIIAGREPTVEAVAQRIAVLLHAHGPLTRHQLKDKLSSAQKAKRDAAVQLGVDSGAFKRELASRYSLQNPAALGLTWDQLDVEKQRIEQRAAARAGASS